MNGNFNDEAAELKAAWIPDLFGPIYKKDSISLRETLNVHKDDKRTRIMLTFLPDELIYAIGFTKETTRDLYAVLLLIDVSGFFDLWDKYSNGENGGSIGFVNVLNSYIKILMEEIYSNGGDVLKYSVEALLAMWKVQKGELIFKTVHNVIVCAQRIQESVARMERDEEATCKTSFAVSAGEIKFSVVGDLSPYFIVYGTPIGDLRHARKICLPGDLVLSSSAWEHCTPSHYDYVIKDSNNIKIIKVLEKPVVTKSASVSVSIDLPRSSFLQSVDPSLCYKPLDAGSVEDDPYFHKLLTGRPSLVEATRRRIGSQLKGYLDPLIIQQIEKDSPLGHLTELRKLTVICVDATPNKCSTDEFISKVDRCFSLLHSTADRHGGSVSALNLYERNVLFILLFGLRKPNDKHRMREVCKNSMMSAMEILKNIKQVAGIQGVSIGVSTGTAFCAVVGHVARRQYMIIGDPAKKAMGIMSNSYDKVSCDYDTISDSRLPKCQFRSRGLIPLRGLGRQHIYEFIDGSPKSEVTAGISSVDYRYPILGRIQELECLNDILDEIGVSGRSHSGLLIKGHERSGKSRLLDAFVTIVKNRQIKPIGLSLHPSYFDKSYSVVHHIVLQILDAEDCWTTEDRERALISKLSNDKLPSKDLCYLNTIMRVTFPLSNEYCMDNDWKRHVRSIKIFQIILNSIDVKMCILLDDIQYIDPMSWQFLSIILDNKNIVIAMTMPEFSHWSDLSKIEADIHKDKRIMKRSLSGLDSDLLSAFACQFFNVLGIPRNLDRILRRNSDNDIAWCEAFLTLTLQSNGLDFRIMPRNEVKRYDLIFPEARLITKIPADLGPEELAPPVPWNLLDDLSICVTNEKYRGFADARLNTNGLRNELFERMNPYEQSFLTSAAILGNVFTRATVECLLPNAIPLHTANTVSEMIRARILSCASHQRSDFHAEDPVFSVFKKRRTFSDMHHLVLCGCRSSRVVVAKFLPLHAHCKTLEFNVPSFRKMIHDTLEEKQRINNHLAAAKFYKQYAKKCITCGGGKFLRLPTVESSTTNEQSTISVKADIRRSSVSQRKYSILENDGNKSEAVRRSIFSTGNMDPKRRESLIPRRVSILPSHLENEESDEILDAPSVSSTARRSSLWRRSTVAPVTGSSSSFDCLKEFSYIDYRDCHCNHILNSLFWQLHQHIEETGETEELSSFLMEYAAGLMLTGQPSHAIKFLTVANVNVIVNKETVLKIEDEKIEEVTTRKGTILSLIGDAYSMLGNYPQAKKFYAEATSLRTILFEKKTTICYNSLVEKVRQKLEGFPRYPLNRISDKVSVSKLQLASCLRRLSVAFMIGDQPKASELAMLKGLRISFQCFGNFLEKGETYIAATRIFCEAGRLRSAKRLEKSVMSTIVGKNRWNDAEELSLVARIFSIVYRIRLLRGDFEGAVQTGIKTLRICRVLSMAGTCLEVLPSLIEILVWKKRVNEAVDLTRELYFLANEDVDDSAVTWYYALSAEFLLDAGIILESYETCFEYSRKVLARKSCVSRDPESLARLLTCLWMWELRMGFTVTESSVQRNKFFIQDIKYDDFSRIVTCSKGLECYLLILCRCANIKESVELITLMRNVRKIMKILKRVSVRATFIKPRLYLLESYLNLIHGRKLLAKIKLGNGEKMAARQGDELTVAWILQNKRTWKTRNFNNMAQYWVEHVGSSDGVAWQNIPNFDLNSWSTILYPLPVPRFSI